MLFCFHRFPVWTSLLLLLAVICKEEQQIRAFIPCQALPRRRMLSALAATATTKMSQSDEERLLMGQVAMTAFIVAEMRHFVNATMLDFDTGRRYDKYKWQMPIHEKVQMKLVEQPLLGARNETFMQNDDEESSFPSVVPTREYADMIAKFQGTNGGNLAVNLLCNTTEAAFGQAMDEGLMSALGCAILFFRNFFRATPELVVACERIGLSDYEVAHHITDMYHHRSFRGAYTKTLAPSGVGEVAARRAVGLEAVDVVFDIDDDNSMETSSTATSTGETRDDDECILWSPTTPGMCLHWKSDDNAWRNKRFERIQMEGTRDPRRGGSGTTR
jgi:hypothetical protein